MPYCNILRISMIQTNRDKKCPLSIHALPVSGYPPLILAHMKCCYLIIALIAILPGSGRSQEASVLGHDKTADTIPLGGNAWAGTVIKINDLRNRKLTTNPFPSKKMRFQQKTSPFSSLARILPLLWHV